jgi:hypothetical protein
MISKENVLMTVGQMFAMGLIIVGAFMWSGRGECASCPTFECYGKCFTPDCVCMSKPGEASGQCYGVSLANDMEQMGWVRN